MRIKTTSVFLAGALVALFEILAVSTVHAQSAEDAFRIAQRFPGSGAKQLGMAGVSRSGLADWTAVTSNPAGLGWMQQSQLLGSLNNWTTEDASLYQSGNFSNPLDSESSHTRLGNAGYVYKAPVSRGSMAFGLGYNQMNSFRRDLFFEGENGMNSITDFFMPLPGEFELVEDDGADGQPNTGDEFLTAEFSRPLSELAYETFAIDLDQRLIDEGSDVPFLPAVVRGTVLQSGDVFEEGGAEEFTISGATEVAKNVMIGAGFNFAHATYRFNRFLNELDVNDDNDGTGITTDFESLDLNEELHSNMWGVNLRSGLSAAVTPNLKLGLTVETPTSYSVREDFSMTLETFFDNGDAFNDRIDLVNEYTLQTPWRYGGGLSIDLLSRLTLSADAEYVDWSQLKIESKSRGDFSFDEVNRHIRRNYDAVVNVGIGGELELGGIVVLRGGYAVQPDPRETEALDRTREYISAGIGLRLRRVLEVDIGWTNEQFEDRYQPYVEVDDAPLVLEDVTRNRVGVGVRFYL